jgi:hypothetical protein
LKCDRVVDILQEHKLWPRKPRPSTSTLPA